MCVCVCVIPTTLRACTCAGHEKSWVDTSLPPYPWLHARAEGIAYVSARVLACAEALHIHVGRARWSVKQ